MQISETLSQELHKQFTVTYPVSELETRVNARLEEMKPRVNLKGFRPGKAPVSGCPWPRLHQSLSPLRKPRRAASVVT